MIPTRRRPRARHDPDAFPTRQLAVLALCRFVEPIAFESILAYNYEMVRHMSGGQPEDSFYAALLVAAYAGAEAASAFWWGSLSDRIGRKPVCLLGLCGVALSCFVFGLADSYWVAFWARAVGGALNGNVAVMQTMVMEIVRRPEHEPLAYATQPFIWSFGAIVGFAMGSYLARPADFYPDHFSRDGLFGRHPYFLPNLVCVVVTVAAVGMGMFLLEETHPSFRPPEPELTDDADADADAADHEGECDDSTAAATIAESTPLLSPGKSMPAIIIAEEEVAASSPPGPIYTFPVVMVIISLILVNSQSLSLFTVFPVYLLDQPDPGAAARRRLDLVGGLGLSLHEVGWFLSLNGVSILLIQGFVVPRLLRTFGTWASFVSMTAVAPVTYLIVPFLRLLPGSLGGFGVYATLALPSFAGIITMPALFILLKKACPRPDALGRINGMAASTTCAVKVAFSCAIGWVYGACGSGAAWASLSLLGWVGVAVMLWTPRRGVCGDGSGGDGVAEARGERGERTEDG